MSFASERQLTDGLRKFFPSRRDVRVGIGDDAAVVRTIAGSAAMCCDPVVGGVHFDATAPLPLVGRKAVNRNLSDLAAMGAEPEWLLVSIVAPRTFTDAKMRALLGGVRAAAGAAGATVVGGDVATTRGPLVVTVSAFGRVRHRPLVRSGARAGDALHVTGPLGGSGEGHHLRFRPAIDEGRWLSRQDGVRAAIDVSDGLVLDLATMLRASGGLGAELDAAAIPVRAAARRAAQGDARAALDRACYDGEDHVLLFTRRPTCALPPGGPLTARARRPIGRVVAEPGVWLCDKGHRERLRVAGFEPRWRS
ncbi:MAG: thiamine-monophosphate kinase [Planctomycetes bacterium]|nr:thiamine-monophosphate kinase [Planctomycetota bacterium]